VNPRLGELLASAGIDDGRGLPSAWSRIVLLQNWGGVPPVRRMAQTYLGNRGFNFLLLGPRGAPTHFGKCRPASGKALRHEIAVLGTLRHDPEVSAVVPRTWGVRSGELDLLISALVSGTRFDRTVARLPAEQWVRAMTEILAVTHRVTERAVALLPDLSDRTGPMSLYEAARGSLAYLESMGLGRRCVRSLAEALRDGGSLHGFPQHGDLWPSNVVRSGRSWWLLDFEVFGQVQIPLYDACHLVRTCSDLRPVASASSAPSRWIDRLLAGGDEATACWRTLASVARRHALGPSGALGALVYYLIDMATRFHKRGGPRCYWEPHALELQRVAEVVASQRQVERLNAELKERLAPGAPTAG
jgi:hypothetical protein